MPIGAAAGTAAGDQSPLACGLGNLDWQRPMRGAVVNLRIALDLVVAAVGSREDELVESMIRRNAAEVPGLGLARDEPVLAAVRAACQRLKSRARKIELVCTCDQI